MKNQLAGGFGRLKIKEVSDDLLTFGSRIGIRARGLLLHWLPSAPAPS